MAIHLTRSGASTGPVGGRRARIGIDRVDAARMSALSSVLTQGEGPCSVVGINAGGDVDLAKLLGGVGHATTTFVEADPLAAVAASQALRSRGVRGVEVVHSDPGSSDTYAGRVPADLVLLGPDVVDTPTLRRQGIGEALPFLLRPGGHVCWWGSRRSDLSDWVRTLAAVGMHPQDGRVGAWGLARFVDHPRTLLPGVRFYPAR